MATAIGLTIEDFEKLPDALAYNHELVDGELIDVSGNVLEHNCLRELLVVLLLPFVEQRKLGKICPSRSTTSVGMRMGRTLASSVLPRCIC
ncbi:MAG: Uma2 family endonuclease [Acidobacteriota bacterium]|nr:Uma2 family endonuclease [Acidobacteriota bacterium]